MWKHFKTITLRKPGKPDYSIPKAYRPIALEDTLSKVVESLMARKLAMLAEQYNLLPPTHFGGRPGRNTTDAILHRSIGARRCSSRCEEGELARRVRRGVPRYYQAV